MTLKSGMDLELYEMLFWLIRSDICVVDLMHEL